MDSYKSIMIIDYLDMCFHITLDSTFVFSFSQLNVSNWFYPIIWIFVFVVPPCKYESIDFLNLPHPLDLCLRSFTSFCRISN